MDAHVIKLDEVVNFYLDAWELPDAQYRRISGFGIRALREIHSHATARPLQAKVELNGNRTADLPGGCLNVLGVRAGGENGRLLVRDDQIGLRDEDCICDRGHDTGCEFFSQRYGYRVDKNSRSIVFHDSFAGGSVFVEYIPLMEEDGEYVVDPFFVEAVLSFMGWQDKRRSQGDRNKSEDEFFNWMRIGQRSKHPMIIAEIFEEYRLNNNILTS